MSELDPEKVADAFDACMCWTCIMERAPSPLPPFYPMQMVLCETCGNKRCPHANDHRNACTNSNEPGQPGSAYEDQRVTTMSKTGRIVQTISEALLHSPLQREGLEALDQIVDKVVELAARPVVRIIRNDEQHQNALAQIAHLMQSDPPAESVDGELLAVLALVVEDYEKKNFPVGVADWHRRSRESRAATNAALASGRVVLQPSTKPAPSPGRRLTRNAAQCSLCGETIESKHVHDFVSCKCGNISVDGGLGYTRRVFKTEGTWTDLSEWKE